MRERYYRCRSAVQIPKILTLVPRESWLDYNWLAGRTSWLRRRTTPTTDLSRRQRRIHRWIRTRWNRRRGNGRFQSCGSRRCSQDVARRGDKGCCRDECQVPIERFSSIVSSASLSKEPNSQLKLDSALWQLLRRHWPHWRARVPADASRYPSLSCEIYRHSRGDFHYQTSQTSSFRRRGPTKWTKEMDPCVRSSRSTGVCGCDFGIRPSSLRGRNGEPVVRSENALWELVFESMVWA